MIKAEWTNADALDLQPICNQLATDLISRQAVIDALTHKWDGMVTSVFDVIKELPSVQPERKKGKWLLSDEQRREDTDNDNYLYFCSNCLRSDIHAKKQEVPYCWWCGADMRGEKND